MAIDPASINGSLHDQIDGAVAGLDRAIQMAGSRKSKVVLHRYSRLLDLERLIFLIRLLLEFPGVELTDPGVEKELRASFLFEPSAARPCRTRRNPASPPELPMPCTIATAPATAMRMRLPKISTGFRSRSS